MALLSARLRDLKSLQGHGVGVVSALDMSNRYYHPGDAGSGRWMCLLQLVDRPRPCYYF